MIFSDVVPDVRWVGNERGIAGDPCWATYDPVGANGGPASPGDVRERESPAGSRHGAHWLPAECDVSIRPGWFWHEAENAEVKTSSSFASRPGQRAHGGRGSIASDISEVLRNIGGGASPREPSDKRRLTEGRVRHG